MTDTPITPERTARARKAWELYAATSGIVEIPDLITDLLHLAERESLGGATYALARAERDYVAEREPVYLAQYRPKGKDWITGAEGDKTVEPSDVAGCLWRLMQQAGFQTGEIPAHVEDLARGHVLTADNGTAFRVIKNPHHRD